MNFKLDKLLALKEINMPGHTRKYVFAERWKVLARIILNKDNNLITAVMGKRFIFNLDYRSYQTLVLYLEIDESDILIWSTTKKNFFTFFCIYFPCFIFYFINEFKELYITTDIQLANYKLIEKFRDFGEVFCVQHGYFPVSNVGDVDGLNSDVYIVRDKQQASLIRLAGFNGKINIFNPIRKNKFLNKDFKTLVFIGPGFSHTDKYENEILQILKSLKTVVNLNILYRPHRRCSKQLLINIKNVGVPIDNSELTSLKSDYCRIFIGVKSTMLLDAQEMGHKVILIISEILPKYFTKSIIKNEISTDSIDKIRDIIHEFEKNLKLV